MSRRLFLIIALVVVPTPTLAQTTATDDRVLQLVDSARMLVAVDADGCLLRNPKDEIVVCGMADIDRKQRLPFPELAAEPGERVREVLPKGNPEIVQQGRCYVTMNERNCFKGVSVFSTRLGGNGSGVGGGVGRIWRAVSSDKLDESYVKQAMIRPLDAVPAE